MAAVNKRVVYERIARFYDLFDLPFEYFRYRHLRAHVFAGLGGDLLDAGVGTGRNLAYYPSGATATCIDLSPAMLARAGARSRRLGVPVDLRQMNVLELEFEDGSFDAIVSTFLFCVLDDADQLAGLKELRRVCRPGGSIRILEYALSERPVRRFIMGLWAPWVRFAYGASFERDTGQYLEAAGLVLVESRFLLHDIIKLLVVRPDRNGAVPAARG